MISAPWDPEQYARFRAERAQPFHDLLALVTRRAAMRIVDLGCGTGELTRELHRTLGARETVGIDSSEAMLAKSDAFVEPGLTFRQQRIEELTGGAWDLVFSNAALQWVPDHEALLAQLRGALGRGGQLAVQVPANHDHASHVVAGEVARQTPFAERLGDSPRVSPVAAPEWYAAHLHRLGFTDLNVRLVVYGYLLESRDEVVEWVKGTLLTDYRRRLGEDLYPEFLVRYREALRNCLADERPYFFPFKRLLFCARRLEVT